jgi:hypothetical protein
MNTDRKISHIRWVTTTQVVKIQQLHAADPTRSWASIGREIGLSARAVSRYAGAEPRKPGRPPATPDAKVQLAERLFTGRPGVSIREIGRRLHIPTTTLRRALGLTA